MRRVFAFFSRNLSGDTPRLDFAAISKSFRRANFFLDRKKSINMSTPMKGHQISGVICIIRIEISASPFDIILVDAANVVNSVYLNAEVTFGSLRKCFRVGRLLVAKLNFY